MVHAHYLWPNVAYLVVEQRSCNIATSSDAFRTSLVIAMNIDLRLTRDLLNDIHADLSRPHPYAGERVAFVSCRPVPLRNDSLALLGLELHPVTDDDYEHDNTVGAMLGAGAFRRILQVAYNTQVSMLHVHRHEHSGKPWFSDLDLSEARKYVPDFWKVRAGFPHGILVLSHDSATGLIWVPETRTQTRLSRISVIGAPIQEMRAP